MQGFLGYPVQVRNGSEPVQWMARLKITFRAREAWLGTARGMAMPLTKDFKHTVAECVRREPAFTRALLHEAAPWFLNGDLATARVILRDLQQMDIEVRGA
jgi:hypothetical protein